MINPNWNILPKETIREFDEKGCLIVRQALDQKTVAHLLEICDRLIDSDIKTNRQTRENGYYDGFRNCIALDDAFLPLLTHPTIFPMVVQFLGAYLHLTTSHLIYKHPDPPGTPDFARAPNWHRDYGRLNNDLQHAAPRGMLKCAYYLTDLTEPNAGATLVVPGSNLLREPLDIPSKWRSRRRIRTASRTRRLSHLRKSNLSRWRCQPIQRNPQSHQCSVMATDGLRP